MTIGLGEHNK